MYTSRKMVFLPGLMAILARWCSSYCSSSSGRMGRVPTRLMEPPDVKVETTFFQRNFSSQNHALTLEKSHKKRTSDFSEVLILRHFFKIHLLSALLPASYQIRPDYALYGTFQSIGMSFPYPNYTYSRSSVTLAHY